MQSITRDVILRAVFGTHAGAREDELRERIDDVLVRTTRAPTQVAVVARRGGRASRARRSTAPCAGWTTCCCEEIRERQAATDLDERDDILSMLVQARDEDGSPLDEDELRDQLVTLLLAGHETTATALAWAFDALFRNPEVLARAARRRSPTATSTSTRWSRRRCGSGRRCTTSGAGSASRWRQRRRRSTRGPRCSPRCTCCTAARTCSPSRGRSAPSASSATSGPSTYAWIPFGGGMRRCLGAAFAQFEMRRVLRTVLEHADCARRPAAPSRTCAARSPWSRATARRRSCARARPRRHRPSRRRRRADDPLWRSSPPRS